MSSIVVQSKKSACSYKKKASVKSELNNMKSKRQELQSKRQQLLANEIDSQENNNAVCRTSTNTTSNAEGKREFTPDECRQIKEIALVNSKPQLKIDL